MKGTTFLALILVAWGLLAHFGAAAPEPQPAVERPSAALAAAVEPVAAILRSDPEDGRRLAAFYLAVADVVSRDQGRLLKSTADLRELVRRAGLLAFQQTGIQGKHAGLAEAIDKVLAEQIGLDNVPLDAKRQAVVIDTLKAVAWASGGGR